MEQGHSSVAIITDSSCDLPEDIIRQYGIIRLPQYVIWGGQVLNDLRDITISQFYRRLKEDPIQPTTAKTNPADVSEAIQKAILTGATEIFGIFVGKKLSGTVDTVSLVADRAEFPFEVFDSRSVSVALGAQVLAAAEARAAGGGRDLMRQAAEKVRDLYRAHLSLATLLYAHRGGRINRALTLIGTALNIKPSLTLNLAEGSIDLGRKVRTRRKALEAVLADTFNGLDLTKKLRFAVAHGDAHEEAAYFVRAIRDRCDPFELILTQISPAVGVHAGPGVIGIGVYADDWT